MTPRLGRIAFAATLASAALAATIPPAQAFYGSFRASCRVLRDDGNYLTAFCRRVDGSWRYTTITNCGGIGVRNVDGHLACGT